METEQLTIILEQQNKVKKNLINTNYLFLDDNQQEVLVWDIEKDHGPDGHWMRVYYLFAKGYFHITLKDPDQLKLDIKTDDPYGGMTPPWVDIRPWIAIGFTKLEEHMFE